MPDSSRWSVPLPRTSLPTYLFTSPAAPLSRKPLYIDADRPGTHFLSLHTCREWSKRLAAGLQDAGLQPGDRVLLCTTNNIFFPVVMMGVIMAGGIYTSGNPLYVARELAHQLKDSGARFVLAMESVLPMVLDAMNIIGMEQDRVFIFNDAPLTDTVTIEKKTGVRHWQSLIANVEIGERFNWKECASTEELNQTVVLNYSSGTTGVAKGVESTHYNYIANCAQVNHQMSLDPLFSSSDDVARNSRWLCALPLYHGFAQIHFLTVAAKRNVPTYIMRSYSLQKFLDNVERFRISELCLVPPIVVAIAKYASKGRNHDLSSVMRVFCGAAPLGRDVSEQFEGLWPLGSVNVKQGWGMTESTCMILGWDPRQHSTSAAVGELLANCEAKLMDEDGLREMPRGQRGELWCRAPNVMKGYWRNPTATAATLTREGWLKTGDIAYIDGEGKYHIVDRKKELIKVKGIQVAPAELEALLLEHPQVQDDAVIGVRVETDERPRAYVVKQGSLTDQQVVDYMAKKTSRAKRITGGVVFTDVIPKNPSGKILRKLLRDRAEAEMAGHGPKLARL